MVPGHASDHQTDSGAGHFQPGGDIRILDAGCGTGKMLVELERLCELRPPVGFDFSSRKRSSF